MSGCWKRAYASPQEAYAATRRLRKIRAYRCQACGQWHTTSQSENQKRGRPRQGPAHDHESRFVMHDSVVDHGEPCPRCHGDGEVIANDSPIGDPQTAYPATCPDCGGDGAARALARVAERMEATR